MKFESKKGQRINNRFTGMTTYEDYWFNETLGKWQPNENRNKNCDYSSHQICKSLRAFRRNMKKAPKGIRFILVSRYVGYNVEAISK